MNTTKLFLIAVLAVIVSGGYCVAAPQDAGGKPPMMPAGVGGGMPMMMQGGGPDGLMGAIMHKLDLTDEQREKIETIIDDNHAKTSAARRAVEKARKALEEAVVGDANEPFIRKAADAVGKAIGDEAVLKVKTMKEIKAVLTPEQIKKLDELKTEMKSRPQLPMQGGQGGQRPRPQGPPPSESQEQ